MKRVDLYLSNPGHHADMVLPVAQDLAANGDVACRLISLCELRGLEPPRARAADAGVEVRSIFPAGVRRSPSLGRQTGGGDGALRAMTRQALWTLALAPGLVRAGRPAPAAAVVPNDGAFPWDRICARLGRAGVPVLLLQEGIRFEQPGATDPGYLRQGRGGAAAVAVWGESSADYYRRRGVPEERLHRVGNPRFDRLLATDWHQAGTDLTRRLGLDGKLVLLVTNPIDDLGVATTEEKLALVTRFAAGIEPLSADPELRFAIKLHPRESVEATRAALAGLPHAARIAVLQSEPLYPLLGAAKAAVVLGSSVGLEALLLGVPLAALEIPGIGFLHDYVDAGVALGIAADADPARELASLLERPPPAATLDAYLGRTLAVRHGSTERVAELVRGLAGTGGAGANSG